MTRRRFFAPPSAFNFTKRTITLTADEARHLREVLRLKPGDEVSVFDGVGKEFRARVAQARREFAELNLAEEIQPARPESPLQITLAVALLKGEKFDLVVQKATELGVYKLAPLMTRFADIKLRDENDASKRVARWQRIALEAAKQCGRAVVPEVSLPVALTAVLDASCVLFSEKDGQGLSDCNRRVRGWLVRRRTRSSPRCGRSDRDSRRAYPPCRNRSHHRRRPPSTSVRRSQLTRGH
jgi:16S rRNA (uracil1498-N3)-methyltransferase